LYACRYGTVKESEADQMLRNKALIIDEIESTLTDAVVQDLNSRCVSCSSRVAARWAGSWCVTSCITEHVQAMGFYCVE
jgi:hypothetical protein